jgi:hypothetical protein
VLTFAIDKKKETQMFKSGNADVVREIEVTLGHYFQGYLGAETETLSKAFHQNARLYCPEDGGLSVTEMNDWLGNITERHKKGDIRQAEREILGIDVTGESAIAKIKLAFAKFSFIDYLSLIRVKSGWIIVNKIYSVQGPGN